jgi:hypothetical protein
VLKNNGNNPEYYYVLKTSLKTRADPVSEKKCGTNFIISNISNYKKKSTELMSLEKLVTSSMDLL